MPTRALSGFTDGEQIAIRAVIRDHLVEDAGSGLPPDLAVDREGAIAQVEELADFVATRAEGR